MNPVFGDFDTTDFWDNSEYAMEEYVGEPLTDELVASIEDELRYKLPGAYVELMKCQNGGTPRLTNHRTQEPTSWAEDHVAITGIYGINRSKPCSLGGRYGSRFWITERWYPPIGVYFCDCPSAGHDMVALDYRRCGPDGEPQVVHVDQELGYEITFVADNFEKFIRGLESEDNFELGEDSTSEGGAAWTPSTMPKVRCDLLQLGRHRLRVTVEFETALAQETVQARAGQYLEGVGYRSVDEAHYRRGSRWGSLTSFTPRGWQAVVTTEVKPGGDGSAVRAFFDVDTFGQQVIPAEVEFWQAEAACLADAVLTGRANTDLPAAYAGRARRAGFKVVPIMIGVALLAAILAALASGVIKTWLPRVFEPILGSASDTVGPLIVLVAIIIAAWLGPRLWRRLRG
jgi:hypothetical protein